MSFVPSIGALDRADLFLASALHSQKLSPSLLHFVRLHDLPQLALATAVMMLFIGTRFSNLYTLVDMPA